MEVVLAPGFLLALLTVLVSLGVECKTVESLNIPRNAPAGYTVTKFTDCKIIDLTNEISKEIFHLTEQGVLKTKRKLSDLVDIGSQISLPLKNSLTKAITDYLHINVVGLDNFSFSQDRFIGTIKENKPPGSRVTIVGPLAISPSNGKNVSYSLQPENNFFAIEHVSYGNVHDNKVIALRSLDREVTQNFSLILKAESDTGDVSVATVEVHILDENDCIPKFQDSVLDVRASSGPTWHSIITVQASDEDLNDRITYSLEGSTDFVIDEDTGEIFSEVGHLYSGNYILKVYATDAVGHVSAPLLIHLHVENESGPIRFISNSYHHISKRATTTISKLFEIVENSTSRDKLFSVATVQPRPASSTEEYGLILSSVDIFQQPDVNGNVYLKPGVRLDYEDPSHREIRLIFNRTNRYTPGDVTILEVTLRVQDKNDEKPVFKNKPVPFLAAVSTNPGQGETVYTLYAEDPDLNSNLVYNLESGDTDKFRMVTEADPKTGDMVGKLVTKVSGPGQFREGQEYTLVVSAQDIAAGVSPPQKSDFEMVRVLAGLRPPQLFENPYIAFVYENSGVGYKILDSDNNILVVRAKCFQDTLRNHVTFELVEQSGKISSLFSITSRDYVETLQNLDYEDSPKQYQLNIIATEVETGLKSTAQIIINVLDMNDNSPTFIYSTYMFTLVEDTPIGETALPLLVTATDRDSGVNGELEYKVSDDHFSIETKLIDNHYVGHIKVAKKLDYDETPDHQYHFNVTATDKGEIPLSGLATVIVYVENVNDEVPRFQIGADHLYATISEEQTVGSVVTIIQARDPDGDNVKYYFTARSTESGPFRIDPDSGLITLARSLPETIPVYMLNITAYDDGSCCPGRTSLSSDTYILVEIRDMNNNQPQFPDCSYEPEVAENQPVGTEVVKVKAIDNDRGSNGNITYSIVTSPLQPKQFEVHPVTGQVVTAVRFDRETQFSDRGVSVTVKAADQGTPQPLDNHCTFWVRIGDVNDNPPVFDSPSYSTSISESSTTKGGRVYSVRASDKDKGRNAAIIYSLTENPGGFFSIEPDSGIIYLEKVVSGEVITEDINVVVKAEDQGRPSLSAYVTVSISVIDRHNNPPTWDSNNYEREYVIKETAPIGYTIATMSASSNTPAPFDQVTFSLVDSQDVLRQAIGPFRIHQDGSTVTLILKGTLNYNIQTRYELRMRVTNQGQIPLSAEIRPVIIIKDMNNEPPQFEGLDSELSNSYKASVPENEEPGQMVLQIKAVDPDHDPPNNLVRYSILEDKNNAYQHFDIDEETGVITTRSTFDREEADKSVYYIKVKAVDGTRSDAPGHFPPDTPNSATAQVQISIADKNDNPPYFTQPSWSAQVPEQRPDDVGRIVTVTAKDRDEENATDSKTQEKRKTDLLSYSITGGNVGSVFGIKQKTGDIYVAKTLDYEVPPTKYNLTVMVSDGLFQNTASVLIEVTDVNDNEPQFDQEVYEITNIVEETIPPPEGQFLLQVFATDKDVSRQTNFRFNISGYGTSLPNPLFTIEPDTGKIYLREKLDRDLPFGRDVYQFNVIAEDEPGTRASLFGYAYVKVRPKDINDNSPVFDSKELQGTVAEHSPAGQSVMTVIAEDYDAGENGTVFYEIDRYGNPPADPRTGEWLFQINSETGLITTKVSDSLDRETKGQYFLQIIAKDKGVEQRSSTATVTIRISDINDQPPVFVEKIYRVHMSENQKAGPVITVSATDNDIDENARLTYTLEETDSTHFLMEKVPPNAGVLTVYTPVDYEVVKFFNLTVKVKDGKHEDEAYIEVFVEDYNDNAPEFSPKVKTNRTYENVPEYTSLWNCNATDADSGQNAEFEYSIDRSKDPGRRFIVTPDCEVKVKRGLDGETLDREALAGLPEEMYEVHILAKDKGYPSKTGTAILRLYIDDLNDNAPEFVLPHPPVVMEGEAPPQHVITFSARDRDTPAYGPPFKFEMVPCNENPSCDKRTGALAFNMTFDEKGANGTGTGTVTALKTFWRDDQKYHYLPIIMSDMRGRDPAKSNTGTSTLTIEIGDINNHEQKPGHKDIFVYKYDFKGVEEDIVIGNVYAEDPDDWDVKDKHYYFLGPRNMAKYFSVNFDDGTIRMNKQTPSGIHDFKAKVHDFVEHPWANVTCTVRVVVEEITDEAIYSSGSVRLSGITAEEFVTRPPNGKSAYDKFQAFLADKLNVPLSHVAVFSVMNNEPGYTDVRYSAHGSPWYPASMLDGIVSLDKEKFEKEAGITIAMVNIDMCLREICESGGCSNILLVGDHPNYVNTNGTAFIGISTTVKAECQCEARNYSAPPQCTPGYCYNGGACIKDEWGDVRCDCSQAGWSIGSRKLQFDGPRCQLTRHSFENGYALFAPLTQCEESTISIEILPKKENGLIFYNGPVSKLGPDDPTDYIALWLKDGYPVLSIDHGSGAITLTVDGRDKKGIRYLQKLNDGRWHHIDIIRKGRTVTMIVDRCDMTEVGSGSDTTVDTTPCQVSGRTPAENYFLNVNTHLQVGGVYSDHAVHQFLPKERFHGCVRNLVNNGHLYDLYTGLYSKGENHVNGCPDEDMVCLNSLEGPRCGKHGICELTDVFNKQYKCTCKPGYRTPGPDMENCDIRTTVRDLNVTSYMSWTLKYDFINNVVKPRITEIQMSFRTRDTDGILLHLPSNTEEFITLELVGGHVQVFYNLGDVAAKGDGDAVLSLVDAPASNGQWHTVYMKRIGKWFQLKMDGGEGRYYNETWGPGRGHQLFTPKMYNIVSGAHVVFTKKPIAQGQDLTKTCIDDIRLNGEWFPMQNSENELSSAAALEYERNVYMGCIRDDCLNVECPKGVREPMVCVPLWGAYECRCPAGTFTDGYNCEPIDYCGRDNPCFSGATCVTQPFPTNFTCLCPAGWTGTLCNRLKAVEPATAGITTGFIIIIIVCIFILLIVTLLVFLLVRYKRRTDPEKYFLGEDLEDDVRENVINYNEEGAGEEDQNAYDISRLRKPDDVDAMQRMPYDPLLPERYPRRGMGEKPDVGRFIDNRLYEADHDPNAPPHDSVREFINEGGNSDVGSLSSLNTNSSQEDQDYDYLNDWGPKFSKLANMYGGDEESDS